MKTDDITLEDIQKAARKIYKEKGWFTAKDIWFELGHTRYGKNQKPVSRKISNSLRKSEICHKIQKSPDSSTVSARYTFLPEEKENGRK